MRKRPVKKKTVKNRLLAAAETLFALNRSGIAPVCTPPILTKPSTILMNTVQFRRQFAAKTPEKDSFDFSSVVI